MVCAQISCQPERKLGKLEGKWLNHAGRSGNVAPQSKLFTAYSSRLAAAASKICGAPFCLYEALASPY